MATNIQDIYNKYCKNNDYLGFAHYVDTMRFDNHNQYLEARQYRQTSIDAANRYNSLLRHVTDPKDSLAVNFVENLRNKNYTNDKNPYIANFKSLLANWGGNQDPGLKITFEGKTTQRGKGIFDFLYKDQVWNETGWDLFKNQQGLNNDDTKALLELKNLGIESGIDSNGNRYIYTDKNNVGGIMGVIQGIINTNSNRSILGGNKDLIEGMSNRPRWRLQTFKDKVEDLDAVDFSDDITSTGNTSGVAIGDIFNPVEGSVIQKDNKDAMSLINLVNDANSRVNNLLGFNADTEKVMTDLIAAPFINQYERNVLEEWGETDEPSKAKPKLEYNEKAMYQQLFSDSYPKYRVFSNDINNNSEVLRELSDSEKENIREILNTAKANKQEIYMNAAMLAGDYGTLVTIQPGDFKDDSGVPEDLRVDKGRVKQYFIAGFCKSAAEETFKNNTKAKAAATLAKMNVYHNQVDVSIDPSVQQYVETNYTVEPTEDGIKTGANTGDYSLVTIKNGKTTTETITEGKVKELLNRKQIGDDLAFSLSNMYYDINGNRINDRNIDIEPLLDKAVNSATQEIYQDQFNQMLLEQANGIDITYRKAQFNQEMSLLKQYILSNIGYH